VCAHMVQLRPHRLGYRMSRLTLAQVVQLLPHTAFRDAEVEKFVNMTPGQEEVGHCHGRRAASNAYEMIRCGIQKRCI
jgi:hypothetical protein